MYILAVTLPISSTIDMIDQMMKMKMNPQNLLQVPGMFFGLFPLMFYKATGIIIDPISSKTGMALL